MYKKNLFQSTTILMIKEWLERVLFLHEESLVLV